MEVVCFFESRDPGRTLVVSFRRSRGQFHFATPLSPSLSRFVSPIPSLGRNKREPGPLVPQQASGSCKKSGQSFFLLNFSCRYACQKKRPLSSNSVFLLLLMPFPSLTWWAAFRAFSLSCFSFCRSFSLVLSLRVATKRIKQQEDQQPESTFWGETSLSAVLDHDRPINLYHPSEQHPILPSNPLNTLHISFANPTTDTFIASGVHMCEL